MAVALGVGHRAVDVEKNGLQHAVSVRLWLPLGPAVRPRIKTNESLLNEQTTGQFRCPLDSGWLAAFEDPSGSRDRQRAADVPAGFPDQFRAVDRHWGGLPDCPD